MNFNVSLGNDQELVKIAFWRIFLKLPFGTFIYIIKQECGKQFKEMKKF